MQTERVKKKVLVTGGAGFIGSHLCDRLIKEEYEVLCLDNCYTGNMVNIEHLLHHSRFTFVEHDVIQPYHVKDLYAIFNLACPASPVHYQKDAIYTTKTAVIGTLNMLELARENNCPILQASTSEVYGDPLIHPQPESYQGNVNPIGIRSCYDEGKRCAESLCMDYHRQYGTKVKIVRIFNTYGPRMAVNDGRVVSNFIVQALQGKPLTIYGDGSQTRSFMYVNDLIEGLMRMLSTAPLCTGPVNLGNPAETSIKDFARKVLSLTGSKSDIVQTKQQKDDPLMRCPDITLASQLLQGWKPQVDLDTGLNQTIEYFKKKALP